MTPREPGGDDGVRSAVAADTLRRLEHSAGSLASACLAAMESRQPWFARLPAEQRAAVQLVTQTGVANFVRWFADAGTGTGATGVGTERSTTPRLTAEAFRIAPRDLARRLSLRQTVELVRIATDVLEQRLPPLAADAAEHRMLSEGVLRFGREIAFAAASVYAAAAEARGAWDARSEALVVDAVVRGPGPDDSSDELVSRAAALGWDPAIAVRVLVGSPMPEVDPDLPTDLHRRALRLGRAALVGAQGGRLVVVLSEPRSPGAAAAPRTSTGERDVLPAARFVEFFGPGPVVVGPLAAALTAAHESARDALAGLRAAPGWPAAPRPVAADDLLPERALTGDPAALPALAEIIAPVEAVGGELLRTLASYLEGGGGLEACARALFVHPNTVRYRLRRVSEITDRRPTEPRDALVLRAAVVAGRLVAGAPT